MRLPTLGTWLSLLAVVGMVCPGPAPAAEIAQHMPPLTSDVQLAADGSLAGMVLDSSGQPVAQAEVWVSTAAMAPLRVKTDRQGRFRAAALRGGVYQLSVGDQGAVFRAWSPETAPPSARPTAMLVLDRAAVRGQSPLSSYFRSNAFLMGTMIAGAIAIPILIHNFRNDSPGSS